MAAICPRSDVGVGIGLSRVRLSVENRTSRGILIRSHRQWAHPKSYIDFNGTTMYHFFSCFTCPPYTVSSYLAFLHSLLHTAHLYREQCCSPSFRPFVTLLYLFHVYDTCPSRGKSEANDKRVCE